MDKWENIDAGPRQVKDLEKTMNALRREGATHDELTGVVDGAEHRSTLWAMFGPTRPEVMALDEGIREKYSYKITRANVREITAAYTAALPEAAESRPTEDNRRTAAEETELRAKIAERNAEDKARQDEHDAVMAQVIAKAPSGVKALIVAEYHEDASDPMTDYFASHTKRTVAIGFRFSPREDFRALAAAAAQFADTAGVMFTEHRENHSMSGGNYLSDHGSSGSGTGWIIRSRILPARYVNLTEEALPDTPAVSAGPVMSAGGVTVSPSSIGRASVVEIRFDDKPSEEVRGALKAHGFRWARGNQCWYGTDQTYAETLAGGE